MPRQQSGKIYDDVKPDLGVHKKIYSVALPARFFGYGQSDINSWMEKYV